MRSPFTNLIKIILLIPLIGCSSIKLNPFTQEDYLKKREGLYLWLKNHQDTRTGLPYSHVGDKRFEDWTILYDAAVVVFAYSAMEDLPNAQSIVDFYSETKSVWRLGGIIEAVKATDPATQTVSGQDWSVRSGANIWMGMASLHLYEKTGEEKYLALAENIATFVLGLQKTDPADTNFGGIPLGPDGDSHYPEDQHISYDPSLPSFSNIYATEVNLDAYAFLAKLYQATGNTLFQDARQNVFQWIKSVGYNRKEHRMNRGYEDDKIATDVHSWAVSSLGVKTLNSFEPRFAEKLIRFIEEKCWAEQKYTKSTGERVTISGMDFIDHATAEQLNRNPLISPEWTFQYLNALKALEKEALERRGRTASSNYRRQWNTTLLGVFNLAEKQNNTLAFPYASQSDALIGHEYRTPAPNTQSAIGAAYGILALSGFDPLAE